MDICSLQTQSGFNWASKWLDGCFVPVGVVTSLIQHIHDKEGLTVRPRQRFHWEPIGVGVEVGWSLLCGIVGPTTEPFEGWAGSLWIPKLSAWIEVMLALSSPSLHPGEKGAGQVQR